MSATVVGPSGLHIPVRAALAMADQRIIVAVLQALSTAADEGFTFTSDDLRAWFGRMAVPTVTRDRIMARLLGERLVRTDGTKVWIADAATLRAWLTKQTPGAAA